MARVTEPTGGKRASTITTQADDLRGFIGEKIFVSQLIPFKHKTSDTKPFRFKVTRGTLEVAEQERQLRARAAPGWGAWPGPHR